MRKSLVIKVLIVLELAVIAFFGWKLIRQHNRPTVLGAHADVLRRQYLIFPKTDETKYFYEYTPSSIVSEDANWMPGGRGGRYTINADGLNARQDYSIVKPLDTYRIIAMGNSFTNGDYIDTPYNYPSQLEDLLNNTLHCSNIKKFEVLNFGVGGYDIQYSTLRYKLRGIKYHPDLILWFMLGHDFYSVNELRTARALQLEEEMIAAGVKDLSYQNGVYYPNWMQANDEMYKKYPLEQLIEIEYKYLSEFGNLYAGPLVLFTDDDTLARYKQLMLLFVNNRPDGYFFDGLPRYQRLPDDHPTAKGYTAIVHSLVDYLTYRHVIPCQNH